MQALQTLSTPTFTFVAEPWSGYGQYHRLITRSGSQAVLMHLPKQTYAFARNCTPRACVHVCVRSALLHYLVVVGSLTNLL